MCARRIKMITSCYKSSMFNHYVHETDSDSLILFNSYLGVNYIIRIPSNKKGKVLTWIESKEIPKESVISDPDFDKLKTMGYFVDIKVDEKKLRAVLLDTLKADTTLRLVIHTSKSCNFRCKYCYLYFEDDTDKNHNISYDTQEGIINFVRKNINKYTSVHVDWFGGEPLLDIEAIKHISEELIKICRMAKKPYEAVITTNGYLLSSANIEILLKNKVKHFAITIDGTKEQHDSLRMLKNGGGTFDQIISNLIYIRDNIKTRTISISIRSNITIDALDHLSKYYSFYNDLFGNDARFYLFIRPVKDMGGEKIDQINTSLFQNNKLDFSAVFDKLGNMIDKIKFDANFVDISIGGIRCYANNHNRYTIGVDGLISKCDESIDEIGIGQLDKQGNMNIDETLQAEWLCSVKNKEKCDDCFFSCCCFMDPCPKARIKNKSKMCPATIHEIDALIKFRAKSYNVDSL